MDFESYLRFAFAMLFVLGLIGVLALVAKRFGLTPRISNAKSGRARRLSIVDVANVDGKRRLVLIRRDDREHLLLLSPTRETVVERNIPAAQNNLHQPALGGPANRSATR